MSQVAGVTTQIHKKSTFSLSTLIHFFYRKESFTLNGTIDKLAYVAGIAGPVSTLPQVFQIWLTKDASSISMFTWVAYFLIAIVMCWYGVIHKERQLIIMYSLLAVVNLMVVVGALIY